MSYLKKSYCFKDSKMRVFSGHISPQTADKFGFEKVNLAIIDMSGKGRGENRFFDKPFENMKKYN